MPRNPAPDPDTRAFDSHLGALQSRRRLGPRYDQLFAEMGARRKMLRERVTAAIRSGRFWEIVKAELARDYQSLFDNATAIEPHIDRDFAATNEPDKPAKT